MEPALVVDNDPDMRDALVATLEQMGVEPLVAINGADALDLLEHGERPRFILLDMMMPVVDGWTFRERQLRDPALASIPVVAMTSRSDIADIERRLGMAVLQKPLRYEQIQALVEQFCR
jgi:CheY-like chemotaxis protein